MQPLVDKSGGGISRIGATGDPDLPRIVEVRPGASTKGRGWIGLTQSRATILRSTSTYPIFSGLAGLLLLIGLLASMWYRERG